ncbi:MAG TPA: FtsW/RodA/SpoVE family cell cycle protein, partial [Candidatus Bathyarchaeia archaeon]|nr:FtsW/RodA/SpoVE family cell cycle protein [Candidatus Bathyarchaeia archaeon]
MQRYFSITIWVCTCLIMIAGLVALYSAAYHNIRIDESVFFDQLFFAAVGIVIIFVLSRVDYRDFYDLSYVFYAFTIVLLFLVLVAGRHA